jgi:hypothetical protein
MRAKVPLDPSIERWSMLCDLMHQLSPVAWKVVTLIARDDLIRDAEEKSGSGALRRDLFTMGAMNIGEPTEAEERSDLAVVGAEGPRTRWTRLSLAEICRGVRDAKKRVVKNRGTGLAKSTAVNAIAEAVRLGALKRRRNKSDASGDLPTSYSIDWKRVEELVEESRRWPNVKTTSIASRSGRKP